MDILFLRPSSGESWAGTFTIKQVPTRATRGGAKQR